MRFAFRSVPAVASLVAAGLFVAPPVATALGISPNLFVVPPGAFVEVAGSIELVSRVSGVPTGGTAALVALGLGLVAARRER